MTNFSQELQFAIDNGIKIDITALDNGEIMAVWNNGQCVEILSVGDLEEVTPIEETETVKNEVAEVKEVAKNFEVGKTYKSYYISNGKEAVFTCTENDGRYAKGFFNNRKEKWYLIEKEWFNVEREEQGLEPDFYYIIADKRAYHRITTLQIVN